MMDGPPSVTTSRHHHPQTRILPHNLFFYVLSLNSHFSSADLRKGALWPSTLQLLLHTAWPLSPQGPGIQRATRLCHPLEIQQQEHLPFLHAALEAFTSCEAIFSPQGWPSPWGLKMLIPVCPFFSWKIIPPSAFKRICSQRFLRGAHWSLTASTAGSFQSHIMRGRRDYNAFTSPLTNLE